MTGSGWEETLASITDYNAEENNVMIYSLVTFACKIIPIPFVPLAGWGMEIYTTILQIMKLGDREEIYTWLLNRENYDTDEHFLKIAHRYSNYIGDTREYDSWNGLSFISAIQNLPNDLLVAFLALNPFLWLAIGFFTIFGA